MFCLFLILNNSSFAGQAKEARLTGHMIYPVDLNQPWQTCDKKGWVFDGHTYHLEYNSVTHMNRLGVDLRSVCEEEDSIYYFVQLLMPGDGQIVYYDFNRQSTPKELGREFVTRHRIPYLSHDGDYLDLQFHLNITSLVTDYVGYQYSFKDIEIGTVIAEIAEAKFHWSATKYGPSNISVGVNPNQQTLNLSMVAGYLSPFLVVDDRGKTFIVEVPTPGSKQEFVMKGNAPLSTVWFEMGGERKTPTQAISAGWIPPNWLSHVHNGKWYNTDIKNSFLYDSNIFAVTTLLSGVKFKIPVPGNNYQADRARNDMINYAYDDGRAKNVILNDWLTFVYRQDVFGPDWDTYAMAFEFHDGQVVYAVQITYKQNPLHRVVAFLKYDEFGKRRFENVRVFINELY
ncbi:MAG: hypothetical protein H6779_00535 [Candidatus Nomurabacteria bacterium]|nr:MAG: hypothetical protein H6779_00535 [Candidatus Nomurabacteria bacterium]